MPTITVTRFRDFGAVIKAARESRGLLRAMNSLGCTHDCDESPPPAAHR